MSHDFLSRARAALVVLALPLATNCSGTGAPRDGAATTGSAPPPQRKAITMALPVEVNALATDLGAFGAGPLMADR